MPKTNKLKNAQKRTVDYKSLDEMLADAERLLTNGYDRMGNWSLAQACGHVADWIRFPMDGFPKPPLFMRAIFGAMRMTGMTKRMMARIEVDGFKPGIPTAPETVPAADYSDQAGVDQLKQAVDRLKSHTGPLHESPLFGPIEMESHVRFSLLHAAHHLGYLHPKS